MQRKINMTTIFFPLDSASFPHFIFNFRILKFEFFFFFEPIVQNKWIGSQIRVGAHRGSKIS
jgi:hypothetical protein